MSKTVSLFYFQNNSITITVDAYFKDDNLVVEGYDIGKTVEEVWGDSDYEYSITVKKENLNALCKTLGIETGNQALILELIKENFSGNEGFSSFGAFLSENKIDFDSFSWT
jgi:hypothetical protein